MSEFIFRVLEKTLVENMYQVAVLHTCFCSNSLQGTLTKPYQNLSQVFILVNKAASLNLAQKHEVTS